MRASSGWPCSSPSAELYPDAQHAAQRPHQASLALPVAAAPWVMPDCPRRHVCLDTPRGCLSLHVCGGGGPVHMCPLWAAWLPASMSRVAPASTSRVAAASMSHAAPTSMSCVAPGVHVLLVSQYPCPVWLPHPCPVWLPAFTPRVAPVSTSGVAPASTSCVAPSVHAPCGSSAHIPCGSHVHVWHSTRLDRDPKCGL